MPELKTLATARDEVLAASVHAAAHLVLHLVGAKRLGRADLKVYADQLRLLIESAQRSNP